MGYGIILSLLPFYLPQVEAGWNGQTACRFTFLGGIASVVFGIVFGGYLETSLVWHPWFNPLEDPITMLIFCFSAGLFHIYFGMGIQAYRSIKAGKLLDALLDQGLWLVFLSSLILIALPQFSTPAKMGGDRLRGIAGSYPGPQAKGLVKEVF